jgi:hypothetical protein
MTAAPSPERGCTADATNQEARKLPLGSRRVARSRSHEGGGGGLRPSLMRYTASQIHSGESSPGPHLSGAVLFVSHQTPIPPRAGNERRLLDMAMFCRHAGWRTVNLICPLTCDEAERAEDELAKSELEFVLVHPDGRVAVGLREADALVRKLHRAPFPPEGFLKGPLLQEFGPDVVEVLSHYVSQRLVGVFDALVRLVRPVAVITNYVWTAPLLDRLRPDTTRIIDTHDVFSRRSDSVGRLGIDDGVNLSASVESSLLSHADFVIAIQHEEALLLDRMLPPTTQVLTCGVSYAVADTSRVGVREPTVGIIGSGNPLNVDGLLRFLSSTWRLVLRELPNSRLLVAGTLATHVPSLAPSLISLGTVADVRSFYECVDVIANPVVAGSGLKIKTIEAISHGRRVVCWREGAAGLGATAGKYVEIAETSLNFSQHLVSLMRSHAGTFLPSSDDDLAAELGPEQVYLPLKNALSQRRRGLVGFRETP